MKKELKVDYEEFCQWYFDDGSYIENALDILIKDGEVSIQCIANRIKYLPLELVQNPEVVSDEDLDGKEIHEVALQEKFRVVLHRR